MRLWTQAIHMGKYVARSVVSAITGDECELDFAFMHFMHATHFFGFRKVIDQKSLNREMINHTFWSSHRDFC